MPSPTGTRRLTGSASSPLATANATATWVWKLACLLVGIIDSWACSRGHVICVTSPLGLMDKASDFQSEDCGLESHRGCCMSVATSHATSTHMWAWCCKSLLKALGEECISRESSPGHIDGKDVFYH